LVYSLASWWVNTAKDLELGVGAQRYVPHPGCTESDKAWLYVNGKGIGFYCNKCGASGFTYHKNRSLSEIRAMIEYEQELQNETKPTLPQDFTLEIPDHGLVWLLAAGINSQEAANHCIGWSDRLQRVILPVYDGRTLLYYQARSIDGRLPKYVNPHVSKDHILYGAEVLDRTKPVCICEDILSVVRVSNIMQAVSPLGTKLSEWAAMRLGEHPLVFIWLDGDKAGKRGRAKMRKQLSWYTEVTLIITHRDPKKYSDAQIKEYLEC